MALQPNPRGGFINKGGTSFIGASLQLLFHVSPFVDLFCESPKDGVFSSIVGNLAKLHKTVDLLNPAPIVEGMQYLQLPNEPTITDPNKFLSRLLSRLEQEQKFGRHNPVHNIFGGELEYTESCKKCENGETVRREHFIFEVPVDLADCIQDGLVEFEGGRFLERQCCDQNMLFTQSVCHAPRFLLLKTDQGDSDSMQQTPLQLSFNANFGQAEYRLLGALLKGGGEVYHTLCRVHPQGGEAWMMYSDASVKRVNPSNLRHDLRKNLFIILYEKTHDALDVQNDSEMFEVPQGSPTYNAIVSPKKLQSSILVQDIEELTIDDPPSITDEPSKKWKPTVPEDLSTELAAAEHIRLDVFDPLLTEEDVPGAVLPVDLDFASTKQLKRWLKCRGDSTSGTKNTLKKRIQLHIDSHTDKFIDPGVDEFKWYKSKREKLMEEQPDARPLLLPLKGWASFPSVDIPPCFNWGHAHVYLVENAPNWTSVPELDDSFTEDGYSMVQDIADNVGRTDVTRKALKFLRSDHVMEIMDTEDEDFYYLKGRVQASMENVVHFPTIIIRRVSGSVREGTCSCTQRTLGRCNHVATLLLFLTRHAETYGYGAKSCTDRPCSWGQGTLVRDPGCIKDKSYGDDMHLKRAYFDPRPTALQHKDDDQLEAVKNDFLKNVQRLYQLEEHDPEDGEYLFDLHLEIEYKPYDEPLFNISATILNCKEFVKNFRKSDRKGPYMVPGTEGQFKSSVWNTVRRWHFTASNAKRLRNLTPAGYKNFLREQLWGINKFRGNQYTRYGIKNEEKALKKYTEIRLETDPTAQVKVTGLWKNPTCMELACSPDGIVLSKMKPARLIEIKCPSVLKTGDPHNFEKFLTKKQQKSFCLERKKDGGLTLKRNHNYYYQIQMSLGILQMNECDFVVWTPKKFFIETVRLDRNRWIDLIERLIPLHHCLLVPDYFLMRTPRDLEPCLIKYRV